MKGRACGFTIIELLLAIVIISVLSAILIPNYLQVQYKARLAASEAVANSVINAMAAVENINPLSDGKDAVCSFNGSIVTVTSGAEIQTVNAPSSIIDVICSSSINLYVVQVKYTSSSTNGTTLAKSAK